MLDVGVDGVFNFLNEGWIIKFIDFEPAVSRILFICVLIIWVSHFIIVIDFLNLSIIVSADLYIIPEILNLADLQFILLSPHHAFQLGFYARSFHLKQSLLVILVKIPILV